MGKTFYTHCGQSLISIFNAVNWLVKRGYTFEYNHEEGSVTVKSNTDGISAVENAVDSGRLELYTNP